MSTHRKRPAPKHRAPGSHRRSVAAQARARAVNTAVRRVVVTPTFAAGLGVVIAAGLAYPTTRTVISYGGAPPVGGNRCQVEGCAGTSPGDLATASPGTRLAPPSAPAKDPDPSAAPAPAPGGDGVVASGPQPVMRYQTLRQWHSGFIGEVTIDPGGSAPDNWQLRLAYESASIIGVWGGQWSPSGDHEVLVTPDSGGRDQGGSGNVQVVLAVSGPPGPPSECAFDGRSCRTGQAGQLSEPSGSPQPRNSPQPRHSQPRTDQLEQWHR